MRLSGRNQMMTKRSLDYCIRKFSEFGFDGLELSVVKGITHAISLDYLDDYVIKHTNELCESLGDFRITALSAHANYVTDDFIFEVQKRLLQTAKKYNTNIVIMSTPIALEIRELDTSIYKKLEIRTKELAQIAEANGVYIAIEVEPNQLFRNLSIFLDIADKVNSPSLKVNFDVGHIYLSEIDIGKAIERCKDFIIYSHIDNMCMGEHCHKLPWDGEIDLKRAYMDLKTAGFDGDVSLDIYIQNYEEVAQDCLKYIKSKVFTEI